jgi:RNA polymerase sigma-70 factor, ECF subfamily
VAQTNLGKRQLDDTQLMQRVMAHDQQALQTLYERFGKGVYSLAYRILQNSTLAEEVTQDTFLKIWQQRTQWDPAKGKLNNWLLTITQFTAIDRLRQEKRQPLLSPDSIEDTSETLLPELSAWQENSALRGLVAQLPPEQAKLIELAFFHSMSHGEIAAATHIPLGTVKTRLRTGLQRLRQLWLETTNQTSKMR